VKVTKNGESAGVFLHEHAPNTGTLIAEPSLALTGEKAMTSVKTFTLAGLIALASLSAAHATPILGIKLQSGASTFTSSSGPSPLTVVQSIGNFTTTVNTGTATTLPAIDLSSVDIVSSAGGTLIITLSAKDFTNAIGARNWLTQFSGNFVSGAATVSLATYLDNTDTLFGIGTALSVLTDTATPFALSNIHAASVTSSPFALTEVLTITTTGAAHVSLDGSITDAPEPASIAVLGAGLVGIGAVSRRRKAATAA
jgi:hypothetical protein